MMTDSLFNEIIVDNFAGGGGASTGIEMAIGRSVDVAINHDMDAIAMYKTNHPDTEHYCESVWDVDPRKAAKGRPVALCWLSPDCKHFSKAKGGKPVDKTIRGLAWVAVRWAATVKPRVIMLENVEEFKTWGPLKRLPNGEYIPDPAKRGITFQSFVRALARHGYKVEYKELSACDYGAPTTRKRLFMVARCDGKPIKWPKPTHGDPHCDLTKAAGLRPWRSAAECIDWAVPGKSIFGRKKPLAENTIKRIVRGIQRFVIEAENPFILQGETVNQPATKGNEALVTAFIAKHFGGNYTGPGVDITKPLHTITTVDHHALVTVSLEQVSKELSDTDQDDVNLQGFILKYYGTNIGHSLNSPFHTVTTKDRFALVTIASKNYRVVDICMRMMQPRELFLGQGFPADYIINVDHTGKAYSKSKQIARCGNAVPPPFAEALVRSNLPELCLSKNRDAA